MNLIRKIKNKYINIDNLFNFLFIFKSKIDNKRQKEIVRDFLKTNNKFILSSKPNIFIAVRNNNWEKHGLVDSWTGVGNVFHYDWGSSLDGKENFKLNRDEFNLNLLSEVEKVNKSFKIDLFFSYLSGSLVDYDTIKKIGSLGIITINYAFDDSSSFWGEKIDKHWSGNFEIAKAFDFSLVAQDIRDIKKYNFCRARSFFLPSGGNPDVFYSLNVCRDIPVSFVGQYSKKRAKYINFLANNGIEVIVRGQGWPEGPASQEEMLSIFQRSLIVLGFGYVGNRRMVRLKGRDFEIPMTGAAYLTTYNKNLKDYFVSDHEILFYKNKLEMLKKIKYYLSRKDKLIKIGLAGEKRSLSQHTWEKRWEEVVDICRK